MLLCFSLRKRTDYSLMQHKSLYLLQASFVKGGNEFNMKKSESGAAADIVQGRFSIETGQINPDCQNSDKISEIVTMKTLSPLAPS